jgi:hypothetical protein
MCLLGQFESNVNSPSRAAIAINPRGVMYCRVVPRHGAAPLGSQDLRLVLGRDVVFGHWLNGALFTRVRRARDRHALIPRGRMLGSYRSDARAGADDPFWNLNLPPASARCSSNPLLLTDCTALPVDMTVTS